MVMYLGPGNWNIFLDLWRSHAYIETSLGYVNINITYLFDFILNFNSILAYHSIMSSPQIYLELIWGLGTTLGIIMPFSGALGDFLNHNTHFGTFGLNRPNLFWKVNTRL